MKTKIIRVGEVEDSSLPPNQYVAPTLTRVIHIIMTRIPKSPPTRKAGRSMTTTRKATRKAKSQSKSAPRTAGFLRSLFK